MPPPVLDDFHRSLRDLDFTRQRMEALYLGDVIKLRDLHSVYEALFLRAVTSFEVFLQDLFTAIMERRVRYGRGRVSVLMRATSNETLHAILMQGRKFVTWLPYEDTVKRASLYLRDGRPFSDLTPADKQTMTTITTIRHAIAHRSAHAMKQFQTNVIGAQVLLGAEKKPAGFLRSQLRAAPAQNRFEVYVKELGRIASDLC